MKRNLLLIGLSVMISGCKVGPHYSSPETIMPSHFIESETCGSCAVADADLIRWWECAFNDSFLDQLLEETMEHNFDLRIALENIFQARANYWVQFTSILPQLTADFQSSHYRTSQAFASQAAAQAAGTSLSPIQSFFQMGLDVIWQIDLYGKFRRSAQSAYYTWEASIEEARGIKISVLSEAASLYLAICYFQTKALLGRELVEFDKELADLSMERLRAGLASEQDVLGALSALESDQALLKTVETALKQNIYSLSVLLGRAPDTLVMEFAINRPIPQPLGGIPETLPSDLLRRRPDIAAAERLLAAQTELIGVAVADLFPSVALTGSSSSFAANPLQGANVGFSSDTFSKLATSASRIWGIGSLITWPVFDFGRRYQTVNIQKILTNQAYLTYEKTVITALQEVEIALSAYFNDEKKLAHVIKQVDWDKRNLDLTVDQFEAGLADYTQVLLVKEKWLASTNALADIRQSFGSDLIAIYKAIGGNW